MTGRGRTRIDLDKIRRAGMRIQYEVEAAKSGKPQTRHHGSYRPSHFGMLNHSHDRAWTGRTLAADHLHIDGGQDFSFHARDCGVSRSTLDKCLYARPRLRPFSELLNWAKISVQQATL